jgi:phosphoribosyl-ATP pyrophosphohydrolase
VGHRHPVLTAVGPDGCSKGPSTLECVKSFDELWTELSTRVATSDPHSGTVRLVNAGVHEVGKKLVEEAAEAWMAAEHESKERTAEELSQLLYHVQVMMLAVGITPADVGEYL